MDEYIKAKIDEIKDLDDEMVLIYNRQKHHQTELRDFFNYIVFVKHRDSLLKVHPHYKNCHGYTSHVYDLAQYESEGEEDIRVHVIQRKCIECTPCNIKINRDTDTKEDFDIKQELDIEFLTDCLYILYRHYNIEFLHVGELDTYYMNRIARKYNEKWIKDVLDVMIKN